MVENLDDRLGIFGARFPYFECHFRRPFTVLIKEYATGLFEGAAWHSLQKPSRLKPVQNISQREAERCPDFSQAPTLYAVWGGGATPQQALYMVGPILPPKAA